MKYVHEKLLGVSTAWLLKIINASSQLLLIKIIVEIYGIEAYAIFAIIAGLWGWVQIFDFGYGHALLNTIIHGGDREKYVVLKKYRNYIIILSAGVIIIAPIISVMLSEYIFRSVIIINDFEKRYLLSASLVIMGFSVVGSLGYKGFTSVNKAWVANVFQILAAVISLLWIINIKYFQLSEKINVTAMIMGYWACLMALSLVGVMYFYYENSGEVDEAIEVSLNIKKIHNRAKYFFMMSLVASASVQSDIIIASFLLEKNEIAHYSYISKIYALMYMVGASITQVIWPQLAKIIKSRDRVKYIQIMEKYLFLTILMVLVGTVVVEFYKKELISFVFEGEDFVVSDFTFIVFGMYTMIRVVTEFFAASIGAFDKLKYSFLVMLCQAFVSVSCSFMAAKSFGIDGLIIGAMLGYLLTSFWMFPIKMFNILK